jgi:hypothetical protein
MSDVSEFNKEEPVTEACFSCSSQYCIKRCVPHPSQSEVSETNILEMPSPCGCQVQDILTKSLNTCLACRELINKIAESDESTLFHSDCFEKLLKNGRFNICRYCNRNIIPGGAFKIVLNAEKTMCHQICYHSSIIAVYK